MNREQTIFVNRLKEAKTSTRRFLKVGEDKAAFEFEWQKNLYKPEEIDKVEKRWGVCGGNGLVPLEADKPEMVDILRKILPPTLEVITPRRQLPHFFYKITDGEVPNRVLHIPNDENGAGEIRSKNQYFVAAGTTIEYKDLQTGEQKTGTYKILHDRPIAEMKASDFLQKLTPFFGKNSKQTLTKDIMLNGAKSGTRHAYGIKYACRLIGFEKLDDVSALETMKRWNKNCKPPMNEKDLVRMIKNAKHYTQNNKGKEGPSKYINRSEKYFTKNKKGHLVSFVVKRLGDQLLKENSFFTDRQSREIFVFDKTHYKKSGETYVHEKCIEELGEHYKDSRFMEVLKYIKGKTYRSSNQQPPLNLINAENGIFDVITKKLYPHDPKFLFFNVASLPYTKYGNVNPLIDFIVQITGNSEDALKLIKWLGYDFLKKNPYQLCLLLVGRTGAGKSVYFDASAKYMGRDNVSHRSLHELCTDKFAGYDLNGRLANSCGDLPRSPLKYLDMFLRIVGGDEIPIQKKFAHATTFRPTQKLAFASNQPPLPKDSQKAFFRRIMLVVCPYTFLGKNRDISILNKLTTEDVRNGILELVADGLNLLIFEGGFDINMDKTQKEYVKWANPIELFFNLCIKETVGKTLLKKSFFRTYTNFCKKNSYNNEPAKTIKKFLEDKGIFEKRVNSERHWDSVEYNAEGFQYVLDQDNNDQTELTPQTTIAKMPKKEVFIPKIENENSLYYIVVEKLKKIGNLALVSKWLELDRNIYQDSDKTNISVETPYTFSETLYEKIVCQKTFDKKIKNSEKTPPEKKPKNFFGRIVEYIRENKTSEGLINSKNLNIFIRSLGLKPIPTNERLFKEKILAVAPDKHKGCWVVV